MFGLMRARQVIAFHRMNQNKFTGLLTTGGVSEPLLSSCHQAYQTFTNRHPVGRWDLSIELTQSAAVLEAMSTAPDEIKATRAITMALPAEFENALLTFLEDQYQQWQTRTRPTHS
jgi:hypothetical protein